MADACKTQIYCVLVDESLDCVDVDLVLVAFLHHHVVTSSVSVIGCGAGSCLKIDKRIITMSSLSFNLFHRQLRLNKCNVPVDESCD